MTVSVWSGLVKRIGSMRFYRWSSSGGNEPHGCSRSSSTESHMQGENQYGWCLTLVDEQCSKFIGFCLVLKVELWVSLWGFGSLKRWVLELELGRFQHVPRTKNKMVDGMIKMAPMDVLECAKFIAPPEGIFDVLHEDTVSW
ncbi:hypothetical protein V6N11_080968 [Hibiscus sabdariffa]|uniref:RNase H type-1 domain-containing protein n=1 Tax=Hibiscus sabdariffa TaxID=183260 RepID=A0ABR2QIU5_9ROSI